MKHRRAAPLRWIPAAVWAAGIWMLSGRPVVPAPPIPYVDKIFHAGEFGVLAVLVAWAAAPVLAGERKLKRWFVVVSACLLYALVDEAHQAFVPGRVCDAADVAADLAGAAVGALLPLRRRRGG